MHGELAEIFEFVSTVRPFDELDGDVRKRLSRKLTIKYFKRQQTILEPGQENDALYIIRTGAVDVLSPQDQFITRVNEKGCFGFFSAIHQTSISRRIIAHEDTLVYMLSGALFRAIAADDQEFMDYFSLAESQRLRKALAKRDENQLQFSARLASPVSRIINRKPVVSSGDVSIYRASQIMAAENVSTLMIVDEDQQLIGLITDRDLRRRVLAKDLDTRSAVASIMTERLITITAETMIFEAGLLMMRHNIHHLPIVENNQPVGLISTIDLLKLNNQSPIYTISEIAKATQVDQLVRVSQTIPEILNQLVNSGLPAHQVGQLISTLSENINIRLIQLAEEKLGPAPVDYCWLAAGSLGRREQLLHSDQDNALLFGNDYNESAHAAYFISLARFVSDGLNECGFVYCPGDVMATNPKWRQRLDGWKNYFKSWIGAPEPKALMYCSIFFDMRSIYGQHRLFDELKAYYHDLAKDNNLFLSHMSINALQNTPPLGFFRQFVLVDNKEHRNKLNLKKRGTAPIVDLARIYSLSAGLSRINTHTRLRLLEAKYHSVVSRDLVDNLLDAYEFINLFRMRHQANQINKNIAPDNFADPKELSEFERDHLRDAFKVVAEMQDFLAQRFIAGHMR